MTTIRLIDARRALREYCDYLFTDNKIANQIYSYLCDGLEECDEVEPERKKGEWILVKGSNGKDYHKCSECLHTQDITGVKNFCAVCGADMREGIEE